MENISGARTNGNPMKFACLNGAPEHYTLRDLHRFEGFEHSSPPLQTLMALPTPGQTQQLAHLRQLLRGSVVEHSDDLMVYIEAGQNEVNQALRSLKPSQTLPTSTRHVLDELARQTPYEGVAYRAIHVTPAGAEALRHIGNHVVDEGVQSASTSKEHVQRWMEWSHTLDGRTGHGLQPVVLVLGENVPKANLASGLLPDHVAVPPLVGLVVRDWRHDNQGQLWCYLTAASPGNLSPASSPFSGERRDNVELQQLRTSSFGHPEGFRFVRQEPVVG